MVSFWEEPRGAEVPCRFCGGKEGDGHLFWECIFSPYSEGIS